MRNKKFIARCAASAALALAIFTSVPVTARATPADEAAIHTLISTYANAWNKKDYKTLGDLFAVDADFSSIYGQTLQGRPIITEKHKALFEGPQKDSQQSRNPSEVTIRFLKPDVASVDSISEISGVHRPDGTLSSMNRALTNLILVKNGAKWEIAVFHNMLLPAVPSGPPPAAPTAP